MVGRVQGWGWVVHQWRWGGGGVSSHNGPAAEHANVPALVAGLVVAVSLHLQLVVPLGVG